MIHLIQVDRDGLMSFACEEIELFTTQGATRDVFRGLLKLAQQEWSEAATPEFLCPRHVRRCSIRRTPELSRTSLRNRNRYRDPLLVTRRLLLSA